jgi:hypothetical protein
MVLSFSMGVCLFRVNMTRKVLLGPEDGRSLGEPVSADAQGLQGSVIAPLKLKSNLAAILKRSVIEPLKLKSNLAAILKRNFDQTLSLGHEEKKNVKAGGTITGSVRKQSLEFPTHGGIADELGSRRRLGSSPLCAQPLPTMLQNQLRLVVCFSLKLADRNCAKVLATIPWLYSDTVGVTLRRRLSHEDTSILRFLDTHDADKIVYDVEEAERHGMEMGRTAAAYTYAGVSATWEQQGVTLATSTPMGIDWTMQWLGASNTATMHAHVLDCKGQELARFGISLHHLKEQLAPEGAAVQVALLSSVLGSSVRVMRSGALDGLPSLFQLFDSDGKLVGIMMQEAVGVTVGGRGGNWLIQVERRQDVDLRAVSMLAITLTLAARHPHVGPSGFVVGYSLPLLLGALALACCSASSRIKSKSGTTLITATHASQELKGETSAAGCERHTRDRTPPPHPPPLPPSISAPPPRGICGVAVEGVEEALAAVEAAMT